MSWAKKLRLSLRLEERAAREARIKSEEELKNIKARRPAVEEQSLGLEKRVYENGFSAAIKKTMVRREA